MNQYRGREQAYGMVMGAQIKQFLEDMAWGAQHLGDIALQNTLNVLAAPNFDLDTTMSLLGIEPGLKNSSSLPTILAYKLAPFLLEEAEIEGHMDVHASTTDATSLHSETGIDGEGKAGYGPVSAKVKIHSQVSVSNERKRSSDYSAGVKWRVLLRKQEPPEMVMKICDALVEDWKMVREINRDLANERIEEMRAKAIGNADNADDDGSFTPDNTSDSEASDTENTQTQEIPS